MLPITITDIAAKKMIDIAAKEGRADHGLRLAVVGGGCSGYQYGMAFEKDSAADDEIMEIGGLRVFVDPMSMMYLKGAVIDYIEGLQGSGFKIENPNSKSSCACGQSFEA